MMKSRAHIFIEWLQTYKKNIIRKRDGSHVGKNMFFIQKP